MDNAASASGVLRRLAFFAILGFMVVILVGPVVAVISAFFAVAVTLLSVFFPFALIGFAVWLPYTILQGRPVPWKQIYDTGKGIVQFALIWPMQAGRKLWTGAVHLTRNAADRAYHYGHIVMEMIAGALLGGLIVTVVRWDHPGPYAEIALGAFIGLVVGTVIGTANRRTEQVKQNP